MKKTATIIDMKISPKTIHWIPTGITGSEVTSGGGNHGFPEASCGGKGCKVIRLPFTKLPNWDTDHVEYKRA